MTRIDGTSAERFDQYLERASNARMKGDQEINPAIQAQYFEIALHWTLLAQESVRMSPEDKK
jgi:hypothetical protein